jgi:hypothetical protein
MNNFGAMSLFNWLKKKNSGKKDDQEIANAGLCPNCWGSQAYDNKFVDAVKDQQISINNHDSTANRAFIQDFVKTHLEPIKLKNSDIYDQSPVSKVKYAKQ